MQLSRLRIAFLSARERLNSGAERLRIAWYVILVTALASFIPLNLWLQRHDSALLDAIIRHDVPAALQAFEDGAKMKMEIKHHSTFLQAAAYQGQVAMAKLLVEHGAAAIVAATDDSGQSALDIAIANHHLEMADYLRSLATDHTRDAEKGRKSSSSIPQDIFTRHLTKPGGCVLLWPLQPKSGFLPEAGCGGTELLKIT